MAIGYTAEKFVWAVDRAARTAYPVHRDLVAHDPDRFDVDERHPVTDERGMLLPSKPVGSLTPQKKTTRSTADEAKED